MSGGRILWGSEGSVFFFDGVSIQEVQAIDPNVPSQAEGLDISTVFSLGSGASASEVVGAWRRGTDYAWIWNSTGTPVGVVDPPNPFTENVLHNP
ncbi:MAG: hypothetical protein HYZ00_04750, partial [Candidatus Hydrogenedentes bacterium]|nr:hypothetical protein [Candidatus Hydrogenedentota bacterium]